VTRRFALLLFAVVASLSVVVAACGSTAPAAPALTDPKEILSTSVLSIKDVKTVEVTGSFTGSLKAAQLGDIDLSSVKMSAAIDIPNKKVKFSLDAPTILGTKIDALILDKVAYYKIAGPFAALIGGSADKYTKLSAADLKALDPTASATGDVNFDLWSRKSDNRPAKITFGVTTVDTGTFGVTLDIKYDVPVTVDAPPADQVVTP